MDQAKAHLHRILRAQRTALLWKLDGLGEREVRLPRTPTGTNLLGLVKHVASIESGYFGETFGRPAPFDVPWRAVGAEPDADLFAAEDESAADVLAFAERAWAHADETIEALPLDARGRVPWWRADRAEVTLGGVLGHVIGDAARHAGHADILREQLDGAIGLRPDVPSLPDVGAARWGAHVERLRGIAERVAARVGDAPVRG